MAVPWETWVTEKFDFLFYCSVCNFRYRDQADDSDDDSEEDSDSEEDDDDDQESQQKEKQNIPNRWRRLFFITPNGHVTGALLNATRSTG